MVGISNFALFVLSTSAIAHASPLEWFAKEVTGWVKIWPQSPANAKWMDWNATHKGLPDILPGTPYKQVMDMIHATYTANTLAHLPLSGDCTASKIVVRKEWGNLSAKERRNYTDALQCLAKLPAKTPESFAPGARSRFDDFLVAHIISTLSVHFSGFFLPWHRQLVWEYERALKDECGYTGFHPYWDWSKWADQPNANPLFDGSDTSISGNGVATPHDTVNVTLPRGDITFTRVAGTGGGCLYNGPLVNWTINLGPVSQLYGTGGPPNPQADGLGYNPHCVIRDFLPEQLPSTTSYQNVTDLILNSDSVHSFHPKAELGVHGGGHTYIGGANNDLFASAGDPAFYMHHTMFDRVWTIWQSLDFDTRVYKDGLDGTQTFLNLPPSANVTLDDVIYLGPAFENTTVREVMSPTSGHFCYIYD